MLLKSSKFFLELKIYNYQNDKCYGYLKNVHFSQNDGAFCLFELDYYVCGP